MKYILLMLMCINLVGCANFTSEESIPPMPDDFNFKLKYGVNGMQEIDTFKGRVVKDLIEDGTIETSISLQKEEMETIYKQMMALDIMEIELPNETSCTEEPEMVSKWNIEMNGETHSFQFTRSCEPSQIEVDLLEIEQTIHKMIKEKPEYKELPEATGGYA